MDYDKLPISIDEQLEKLRKNGLIIEDSSTALFHLSNVSYFRIESYLRSMEVYGQKRYKPNSTFERAVRLYLFDKDLRATLFNSIQDVEVSLRTKMTQIFSMKHGAFWFTDASLFKDETFFNGCLATIEKELSRSNEEFIKEHTAKYSRPPYPPAWKTLEIVSLGTLSKPFCLFKDTSLKKVIAREYALPQYTYLESWIRSITMLRNCCAHHARVWNRRFAQMPLLPEKLTKPWITTREKPMKVYHQLCILLYLEQSIEPKSDIKYLLSELFREYEDVIDLQEMGFPINWEDEPLWRE